MPTALVVETGSQSTTANSYITQSDYNTYINDRHITRAASPPSSNDQISYIHQAMSYFEALSFKGKKATETQALQFPRTHLTIDGYDIDGSEIPIEVKESIYELAYAYEQGYGLDAPIERATAKEKVGELEVEYKSSSADRVLTPAATRALRKLVHSPTRVVRI